MNKRVDDNQTLIKLIKHLDVDGAYINLFSAETQVSTRLSLTVSIYL